MKIIHLRNILAIAEQGSLRAAARKLELAQPALSRSVQELEHELGTPLFERRTRGMTLTPVGIAFVERAKTIMAEIRKAREEAEQLAGGTTGNVKIVLSVVAHFSIAPKILRPFAKRYPNVQLQIIEGLYTNAEKGLKDSEFDFYVGPPPEHSLPAKFVSEKLFDNERKVFCRKDHPLAGAKSIKELANASWMTTSITHSAQNELAELFRRYHLPLPRLAIRSQSALTFMTALAYSDCIAFLPVQWASFPLISSQLAIINIKEVAPAPPVVIVKRSDMPLTPAAEFLLDLIRRSKVAPGAQSKPRKKPPATKRNL